MKFLKRVSYSMGRLKIILVFILITSLSLEVFCQEDSEEELDFISLKKSKKGVKGNINTDEFSNVAFKLSFFMPSIGTEIRLSDKFSLEVAGKLNFAIYSSNSTGGTGSPRLPKLYFFPLPVIHVEPKWNYNINKRLVKGKTVSGFSSNFISLFTSYKVKVSDNTFHNLVIGPTWGIQRKLGKVGYFKFNAGLAYTHVFDSSIRVQYIQQSLIGIPVGPIVDIQIGIIF
jgi:hypothetical protein